MVELNFYSTNCKDIEIDIIPGTAFINDKLGRNRFANYLTKKLQIAFLT